MQRRYHVMYFKDFETALQGKKNAQKEEPNKSFQIRKRKNNFELVGRIDEVLHKITPKVKPPRPLWKKSNEAPKFEYEYSNQKARDNGTGKWTGRVK